MLTAYDLLGKGKYKLSELETIDQIRTKGIPIAALDNLSKEMTLTKGKVCELLGLSSRTISRRTKLKTEEADKLFRLARVYALAINVLENKKQAIQWLNTTKVALNHQKPLDLMDTEIGSREVEKLLKRIEYGVYS